MSRKTSKTERRWNVLAHPPAAKAIDAPAPAPVPVLVSTPSKAECGHFVRHKYNAQGELAE
jgi:hypothetical protein